MENARNQQETASRPGLGAQHVMSRGFSLIRGSRLFASVVFGNRRSYFRSWTSLSDPLTIMTTTSTPIKADLCSCSDASANTQLENGSEATDVDVHWEFGAYIGRFAPVLYASAIL
jgi:hypothetical protein